jgi:hypothetical protein
MYGVPSNLPLQQFVGLELEQLALGLHQVQFRFHGSRSIHVEGRWQIFDSSGTIVDESIDEHELPSSRQQYKIHVILGSAVTGFRIDAPDSFSLVFSSGHTLTIYDDSPAYESFSIHPDGIYI